MRYQWRLVAAFCLGLVAAAIPILTSTTPENCSTATPPDDAPRYLVLTSDSTSRGLRCGPVGGAVVLERVASHGEASARLEDEAVAGIIFDRGALEAALDGAVRGWLVAGNGNVLIGMSLTKWEVEAYLNSPPVPLDELPPEQRGESTYLRAYEYVARLRFQRFENGTCGGRGTPAYTSESRLAELLVRSAEGCRSG